MAMTVTAKKEVMEQEGTKALHKARKVYDNEPTIDEWKPQKWNLCESVAKKNGCTVYNRSMQATKHRS